MSSASQLVVRALILVGFVALAAVLAWVVTLSALGAIAVGGSSNFGSVLYFVPVVPLALGVVVLALLLRAGWWSRSWRKIAVAITAVATMAYGALFVNEAPWLYGIGGAHNAWTLTEMLRYDLVRVEELDVGDCMYVRYATRGAPPSHLVRPTDCTQSHNGEVTGFPAKVTGVYRVDVTAPQDAAAVERLAERKCVDQAFGGVSWFAVDDASPLGQGTVVCAIDDSG
jgi:hypothetical protein